MADFVSNNMAEDQRFDLFTVKHRRRFMKYAARLSTFQQTPALLLDAIRQYIRTANTFAVITKCKSINVPVITIEPDFAGGRDKHDGKFEALRSVPRDINPCIVEDPNNVLFGTVQDGFGNVILVQKMDS